MDLTSFEEVGLSHSQGGMWSMKARDMDEMLGTNARLAIVLTLADGEPWTFTDLRAETGLADGNLHVQAGKLVLADYLHTQKVRQGNRLVTSFSLSPHGLARLTAHVKRFGKALPGLDFRSGQGNIVGEGCSNRKMPTGNDGSQVW